MHSTTGLAWGLWATSVLLFGGALGSSVLPGGAALSDRSGPLDMLVLGITLLAFPTVGALIAARRPRNPLGWLFCLVGLCIAIAIAAGEYRARATYGGVGLPAVPIVAWLSSWVWLPGFATAVTFLPLLFPTGRPPTPRWRPVAWVAGLFIGAAVVSIAVAPGSTSLGDPNPFAVGGPLGAVAAFIAQNYAWGLPPIALVCVAAFLRRFIGSRGAERVQLKWVAYAITVMALGGASLTIPGVLGLADPATLDWASSVLLLGIGLIPAAAGVAILRYRLYDIDLLINRTLVYASLTVTLGVVYAGCVIALQSLLAGLAGGSSLAVAASTLAIAALFRPVRQRVQRTVDRRFYRSKYDAQRTLERFSARLRDEVDLRRLTDELRGAVEEALQPSVLSVWLRR